MNWAAMVWLALLVVFLWMEASTVTVISMWFAAGALVAMVASLLGAQLWLQLVLFMSVSGLFLLLLRPLVRKHFTPKLVRTNVDAVVGKEGIVTERIDNLREHGTVKLGGMTWTARSTADTPIPEGTQIRVDRIEGVKVYVSPAEEKVSIQ